MVHSGSWGKTAAKEGKMSVELLYICRQLPKTKYEKNI